MNTTQTLILTINPYRRRARPVRAFSSNLAPRVHVPRTREAEVGRSGPSAETARIQAMTGLAGATPP